MSYDPAPAWTNDPLYQKFKKEVEAAGLLKKTPTRHVLLFLASLLLVILGLLLVQRLDSPLAVAGMAFLIAFPRSWIGYIGHDISHGQVFNSRRISYATGVVVWNLLTGIRMSSWERNHHPHHYFTNKVGHDPDVDNPFVFSDKQNSPTHLFARVLPRFKENQHLYFFLMLPFIHSTRMLSVLGRTMKEKKDFYFFLELVLLGAFLLWYFSFAFFMLGPVNGAIFAVINYATVAAIAGLAFAPNHKGQPMLGPDELVTYKTQIISSRNLSPHPIIDFLYGGLNYQIEHHLFTEMSRFNYPAARSLVKEFCSREGLPYHETTPWGSLHEMYVALKAHRT